MRKSLGALLAAGMVTASFGPETRAAARQSPFPFVVTFASDPAWSDTWYAPWTFPTHDTPAGSIAWTRETSGGASDGSGDASYLRAVRDNDGSSVLVLSYPVPANSSLYVGCWIRCPSYDPAPSPNFWVEAAALAGTPSFPITVGNPPYQVTGLGQHYDDPNTGAPWTVIKKFEGVQTGANHDNGNVWTWYSTPAPIPTGSNTVLHLAFKVGARYSETYEPPAYNPPTNVLDVGYDGFTVSENDLTAPPGTFNPPPTGGSGGGGTGVGGGGGGGTPGPDPDPSGTSSGHYGCQCTIGGGVGLPWALAALFLAVSLRRRRE